MKLINFRIKNYKSIKDTGLCWLASDLTTLAGKNESGKTAILEALRDFNTDVEIIPDSAMPLNDSGEPVIEMCFDVDKVILDEIAREIGITVNKEIRKYISKNGATIVKNNDGSYDFKDEIDSLFNKQRDKLNSKHTDLINNIIANISEIEPLSRLAHQKVEGGAAAIQQAVNHYIEKIVTHIASIPEEETKEEIIEAVNELKLENNALDLKSAANTFLNELLTYIPNFIFFSDFLDILPFEVVLAEAKNHKTVLDFAKVANLDLDKVIAATDLQRRRNILSKHSASISGDFMEYWDQNRLDLVAEPDGEYLRIGIKEAGKTLLFKPEQRSKGFQWFLSFYLRLNAERDEISIILIDEPGLYLHAKAQENVMNVLENIAKESQIIFSTHSPYLIDTQRLDRVRLVLKDDHTGTQIENKIHKRADTETLTPIITAIGLDISKDFSIAGKKNVLLEGISDYYIVQALRHYIKINNANFIPCVGAPKFPQIVSLLIGWDLEFLAVLDNDSAGKRIAKVLIEKLSVESDRIIFVSEQDGFSIEDLFTHDDFNNFVLDETKNENTAITNSRFLKYKRLDKVLLAKKFFEKVKEDQSIINLSQKTVNVFRQVFKKIDAGFKKS